MCEAGAEPWLLETLHHPVDHLTRSAIFLPRLLWVPGLGMQTSQSEMGLPELPGVANHLSERHRLAQPALGFVSLMAGKGDFSL
jgi:hypothetical protein